MTSLRELLQAPIAPFDVTHRQISRTSAVATRGHVVMGQADQWWPSAFEALDAALLTSGGAVGAARGAVHGRPVRVLAALPDEHRGGLLQLRALILDVAEEVGAAPVHEVLRWGQPSYLSAPPRECTTIRLGSSNDRRYFALFFHCRSTVLEDFRSRFPDDFRYDGNRAIRFEPGEDLQEDKLCLCIGRALRYRAASGGR